jgi:hypothetical protein
MLEALVGGERDPVVLAELARGVLRKQHPLLRQALKGRFSDHHALLVGLCFPTWSTWSAPSANSTSAWTR